MGLCSISSFVGVWSLTLLVSYNIQLAQGALPLSVVNLINGARSALNLPEQSKYSAAADREKLASADTAESKMDSPEERRAEAMRQELSRVSTDRAERQGRLRALTPAHQCQRP